MLKVMGLACAFFAVGVVAGCLQVNADASGLGGGDRVRSESPPPPDAATDPRSTGDLVRRTPSSANNSPGWSRITSDCRRPSGSERIRSATSSASEMS